MSGDGPGRRPRVVVLDYGSGNLRSAERALARVGADVTVTADLDVARGAAGLVVPGVGAYAACMAGIDAVGAAPVVRERVAAGRPVLGICVGMQVLYELGDEHGVRTVGLGVIPGEVRRLAADILPHMGWNTVAPPAGSILFAGLPADTRFYFVHSYAAKADPAAGDTVGEHGEPFAAAVERGALAATQFHPEKSGDAGAHLLANWLGSLV
ncbi:imidazole glycerol phosphate synthase subunit hisH [Frankia casuarinae]|uniref:Imidazole glycerol phosphate synthase subunit HisH n=1 Tax=Frankia casuarinae (strain DSM 45818 / CECT 9043 / HFP020203 / CcI3) TaxID=106370 RepID=Q2J8L1_FRACC|nr:MULTISPECIES: imidazole glycerol phosphate synthase subunit HisH [Frankia]ABD12381.1 imidazole glycerol phosphate synthase subunit hisH [Frankia casuarinae]ETA02352.1 imidazole glycerol phosphate synthase subunit hisH [Frankia sp. CcI6]EYT91297.1 imidazole glycerol phosphate synthase subunit hisH [Frankia casuarinae]KDA44797.1 imidazole glycerol phosphate synthase subunit hisH [Frankia sp. BMG5.23]OAA24827.1 imidazole glycerol phosphate synthase subunit hisH [Frankia casuarinae]